MLIFNGSTNIQVEASFHYLLWMNLDRIRAWAVLTNNFLKTKKPQCFLLKC